MKRAHVYIYGKVQGVWFRAHTKEMAIKLNIKGWVRNLADGSVEAVFEGIEEHVDQMIHWCNKGSPRARVSKVDVEYSDSMGLTEFKIYY